MLALAWPEPLALTLVCAVDCAIISAAAGGSDQPAADIAKTVAIESDRRVRLGNDALGADDVGVARGVDREHDHHRRRLHRRVGNLEADLDLHRRNSAAVTALTSSTGRHQD